MDKIQVVSHKPRSSSAESTASSVTEYVNEVFADSELELSKVVSIQVSKDLTYVTNPLEAIPNIDDVKTQKQLQNFGDTFAESSTELTPKRFRWMYIVALVVLMFPVSMGLTATYSSTATEDMKKRHSSIHPTDDEVSWIGSLLTIGALVGGSVGGYITNVLGRKGTLMFNTVPFVVGWILVAYAPSVEFIYIGRIVTGFSCGIVSAATPIYLVEISTPEVRGMLGSSFQLFVVVGILIVSCLGAGLTWRYLAVAGAIMCLLAAFLMLPMPESPRWLISQKRRGEAKLALTYLQGEQFDAEAECRMIEEEIRKQPTGSVKLSEFGFPNVYKPFILSISLMFFQQFSGVNAILFYTVQIFKSAGSSLDSTVAAIIVATVQVLATFCSSILIDRAGRKPLLLISGACMAVSFFTFGGYELAKFLNKYSVAAVGWLPLVCLISFISAFSIGFGPTPWLMVAEMTPSRFRSVVSGVATGLNWTFAFIVTKNFTAMYTDMHPFGVYWWYGAICCASVVFTALCLPETKGKTMAEIEEFFSLPPIAAARRSFSESFSSNK